MIKKGFKIDFEKKTVTLVDNKNKNYSAKYLYSLLMDLFDEPENMKYDIPIQANQNNQFELINGWRLEGVSIKNII